MEKKKLKQKRKSKSKKTGFFKHCCGYMSESETNEIEDTDLNSYSAYTINLQPKSSVVTEKHAISVTYQKTSSYFVMNPIITSLTPFSSKSDLEKLGSISSNNEIDTVSGVLENTNDKEKEEKETLVKTILSKYLEIRQAEENERPPVEEAEQLMTNTLQEQNSNFHQELNIECFSSDSTDTVLLPNPLSNQDLPKPNIKFPTKSRSAPTNSKTYDSLADLCLKLCYFKQSQEHKSDSHVTCSSEENANSKKKLELIFNQSSEEISMSHEDNSAISLQYKISCEGAPVMIGTLRADSVLQLQQNTDDKYNDAMRGAKAAKFTAQELHLEPSARGEIDGNNGSSSSLKWKLIISHHGDFR